MNKLHAASLVSEQPTLPKRFETLRKPQPLSKLPGVLSGLSRRQQAILKYAEAVGKVRVSFVSERDTNYLRIEGEKGKRRITLRPDSARTGEWIDDAVRAMSHLLAEDLMKELGPQLLRWNKKPGQPGYLADVKPIKAQFRRVLGIDNETQISMRAGAVVGGLKAQVFDKKERLLAEVVYDSTKRSLSKFEVHNYVDQGPPVRTQSGRLNVSHLPVEVTHDRNNSEIKLKLPFSEKKPHLLSVTKADAYRIQSEGEYLKNGGMLQEKITDHARSAKVFIVEFFKNGKRIDAYRIYYRRAGADDLDQQHGVALSTICRFVENQGENKGQLLKLDVNEAYPKRHWIYPKE